jgi:hypothetical protein
LKCTCNFSSISKLYFFWTMNPKYSSLNTSEWKLWEIQIKFEKTKNYSW